MNIVFHGENAASFTKDFADLVGPAHAVAVLPDRLERDEDRAAYAAADVIVGVGFHAGLPQPTALKLFHVPGAGYDAVDLGLLPASVTVCNCFGHEQAISEYVMSAILARHVPLQDADQQLRQGHWAYWAGAANRTHDEMSGKTIGLIGYGHIGKAIAKRAKAFEMRVHVANRTPVPLEQPVDRVFGLDQLEAFYPTVDYIVMSLPLTADTKGLVDQKAFASMKRSAVVINVGRGATIDEQALYDALRHHTIAGAVIDTWYQYPAHIDERKQPGSLAFNALEHLVMTPHMSGWTDGTIRRRQNTIAQNIIHITKGEPCINVVRQGHC